MSDLVQGSNNFHLLYTKIKALWDELDIAYTKTSCSCACECGGKDKVLKSVQDERLIKFLMGLNDTFATVKSNIIMMSPFHDWPLPTVNKAYALLIQDEKQREISIHSNFSNDSSSFLVNGGNNPGGQYSGTRNPNFKGKKSNVVCSFCKKVGHTVDKCYRVIRFPSNFKFTKTRGFQRDVKISDANANAALAGNIQGQLKDMCFDSRIRITLRALPYSVNVNLPNGFKVKATHAGSVALFPELIIHNAPSVKRPLVLGQASHGLYQLFPFSSKPKIPVKENSNVRLWHVRFGHMPFSSMKNLSSFLFKSISDYYFGRATWTYLLNSKGNAFSMLKQFLSMVERQFNKKFKQIRYPSRVLNGKTPYEVIFQHPPDYQYLRCFGCLCFVSTPAQNRSKFAPRANACVFIGYPFGQKGYKVLHLKTRKISVSRDVVFHEETYPFKSSSVSSHLTLFPSSPNTNLFYTICVRTCIRK
ncbi:uncharacterized protein LOC132034561 [Lycium ferocissimum]|uniref:uncharacterized protein LOC132034561 n=1 Tax=Lycium ferocissimum TaxID=112874 RepID=UPI002816658E|nr:uncharacterized protein LOC132034561 [Lycium ferocissimum]